MHDTLTIAGREFGSRLLLGTGKYDTFETMRDAVAASGTEIVTVAVRRIDFDAPGEDITSFLPEEVLLLPNTSGCETADEAVRSAKLARAGGLPDWVKLEVIPDPRYLLPDPVETLKRGGDARRGRLHGPALRPSGPRPGQEARGGRLRDGHAARGADRKR